jgi:hypothetical protein
MPEPRDARAIDHVRQAASLHPKRHRIRHPCEPKVRASNAQSHLSQIKLVGKRRADLRVVVPGEQTVPIHRGDRLFALEIRICDYFLEKPH